MRNAFSAFSVIAALTIGFNTTNISALFGESVTVCAVVLEGAIGMDIPVLLTIADNVSDGMTALLIMQWVPYTFMQLSTIHRLSPLVCRRYV